MCEAADLLPERLVGGWHGEDITDASPLYIMLARKPYA
jgi:hypothetical protein